jgi:hypothetical protein
MQLKKSRNTIKKLKKGKQPKKKTKLPKKKEYFLINRISLVVSSLASGTPSSLVQSRPEAVGFFRCGKNLQACLPSEGK